MKRLCFLAGFASALALSCGGSSAPLESPLAAAPAELMTLVFEELWEPRTAESGVFGAVATHVLADTPDGSDPQQAWASNKITGRWGTLRTLDGTVPGLPDVTGLGPNASWAVGNGRLAFRAEPAVAPTGQSTGGYALITRQIFDRSRAITVEADIDLARGTPTAFAGMALIAGEGDYRELAIYRTESGDQIDRVTPLRATTLAKRTQAITTLRMEYDPATGFRYFADGQLLGVEAIDHERADFSDDPQIGLYFTGNSNQPGAFVEGSVGPVRVWQGAARG